MIWIVTCPMPSNPEMGYTAKLSNSGWMVNGIPVIINTKQVMRALIMTFSDHVE